MMCRFGYEGRDFKVPLSGIENISAMVSCKRYECASRVLITNN